VETVVEVAVNTKLQEPFDMWTLERGVDTCRTLERIVKPFGFSVALYGSVLINGTGDDLDVYLVPQKQDADVRSAVEGIRDGLHCGVDGPYGGDWNRLWCIVRLRPDRIDAQFTRLSAMPKENVGHVCYEL
jgi:hypothetical protein